VNYEAQANDLREAVGLEYSPIAISFSDDSDPEGSTDKQVSVVGEILQYRELLRSLTVRDLKVKYQRSLLGLVWTLLQPLLNIVILVAVFSYIVRIEMHNYWAFLISGFFAWNFISLALNHATSLIIGNAALSRSVYFPREILVLSAASSKLVEFLFEIAIVIVVLLVFHFESIPGSLVLHHGGDGQVEYRPVPVGEIGQGSRCRSLGITRVNESGLCRHSGGRCPASLQLSGNPDKRRPAPREHKTGDGVRLLGHTPGNRGSPGPEPGSRRDTA